MAGGSTSGDDCDDALDTVSPGVVDVFVPRPTCLQASSTRTVFPKDEVGALLCPVMPLPEGCTALHDRRFALSSQHGFQIRHGGSGVEAADGGPPAARSQGSEGCHRAPPRAADQEDEV